jgi:hypothetical protein
MKDDVPVDSETLLMTDFVNLKIKPAQSFKNAHRDRMCVHVFIVLNARMCMNIYVCIVFLKKYLGITRNMLSTIKEDLKQAQYNLTLKDDIISEQKKSLILHRIFHSKQAYI